MVIMLSDLEQNMGGECDWMSVNVRVQALLDRAKADAQLQQDLLADANAVFERELGVSLKDEMSDSELANVDGGAASDWLNKLTIKCPLCKAEMKAGSIGSHMLFVHGS